MFADESNGGESESLLDLSEQNKNGDIGSVQKDECYNKIGEKICIVWTTIKSSIKLFGCGMLFGIICTILCIYFRPDKYIWNKLMKIKSKKCLKKHRKKNSRESHMPELELAPESQSELESQSKTEPKPESQPEIEGKPESQPKIEPKIEPKPESQLEIEGKPESQPKIEPKIEPKPESQSESSIVINPTTFMVDIDNWSVIGTSVIGNSHISMNLPCQDNCKYEYIGDGWGIAVTSDGAGSAKRSEIGSKIVVERAIVHFKKLIEEQGWKQNKKLPTNAVWMRLAYDILHQIYQEIISFAKIKGLACKDLSATVIVLIHTPMGVLCTHIGDGRAGYRNASGEWKALFMPHKGDEANQTIFITSDFWSVHNYTMSDVLVPESIVINDDITAFTLMSDGCEYTAWQSNHFDNERNKYYDPNKPYDKFYESLAATLIKYHKESVDINRRKEQWQQFLIDGNKSLQKEPDDKTLILGVLCN